MSGGTVWGDNNCVVAGWTSVYLWEVANDCLCIIFQFFFFFLCLLNYVEPWVFLLLLIWFFSFFCWEGWGAEAPQSKRLCCTAASQLRICFTPLLFDTVLRIPYNTSGPAGGQRKTSTFVSFLVIFLIWYFSYVTFKWKDTKSLVIFGDFIPFALSWQWTQRPAGDSMKDMKELLNNLFKTCCQLFLFFSGLISIKGWKLKRLLTYESTWKSSYTRTVKTKIKYSTTIFFRKGKCLGSSCWDHPASLHKWGPWYHRETRMFQLHSFVR